MWESLREQMDDDRKIGDDEGQQEKLREMNFDGVGFMPSKT